VNGVESKTREKCGLFKGLKLVVRDSSNLKDCTFMASSALETQATAKR